MQIAVVIRTLGVLLLLFSATLIPPLAVSWLYGDGELRSSVASPLALHCSAGLLLWLPLVAPLV